MQTIKDKKHNKYQEMQRTENFQVSIPNKSKKFLFIQTEMTKRFSQDVKDVKQALYNILESNLLKSYPTFKQCKLEILDSIPQQQHLFKFTLFCTKLQKAVIQMSKIKQFNQDVNQNFTVYMNFERNQLKFDKQKQAYRESSSYIQQDLSVSSEKSNTESSDYPTLSNRPESNNLLQQQYSSNGAIKNQPLDLISSEDSKNNIKGIQFDQDQEFPDILQAASAVSNNEKQSAKITTPQNILNNLNISNANDTTAVTSSQESPKNLINNINNLNNKNFLENAPNLLQYNCNNQKKQINSSYQFDFLDKENNNKLNPTNNNEKSNQSNKGTNIENPEDQSRNQPQNHITNYNQNNLSLGNGESNVQIQPNDDNNLNSNNISNYSSKNNINITGKNNKFSSNTKNNNNNESEEQQQLSEQSSQSHKRETSLIMDILHKKSTSSKYQNYSNFISNMSFQSDKFDNFQRNTNFIENQEKQQFLIKCLFPDQDDSKKFDDRDDDFDQSCSENDIESENFLTQENSCLQQQLLILEKQLNALIENNAIKEKALLDKEQYYLSI